MTEAVGYEKIRCQVDLPGCEKTCAGYLRYKEFCKVGPLLDACEHCARKEYKPPKQFQEETKHEPK
jgi:hypothetical protein